MLVYQRVTYLTSGNGNSSSKVPAGRGYVSSQEGSSHVSHQQRWGMGTNEGCCGQETDSPDFETPGHGKNRNVGAAKGTVTLGPYCSDKFSFW